MPGNDSLCHNTIEPRHSSRPPPFRKQRWTCLYRICRPQTLLWCLRYKLCLSVSMQSYVSCTSCFIQDIPYSSLLEIYVIYWSRENLHRRFSWELLISFSGLSACDQDVCSGKLHSRLHRGLRRLNSQQKKGSSVSNVTYSSHLKVRGWVGCTLRADLTPPDQ